MKQAAIACHQAVTEADGTPVWQRIDTPNYLVDYGGVAVLDLPAKWRATVNGIPVLGRGLQAVQRGDLVRVANGRGTATFLHIGEPLAAGEAGNGRPDDFTGNPISGQAIRCSNCRSLYAATTTAQFQKGCPICGSSLQGDKVAIPPEELL
jgi:hypothetical protein